MGSSVIDNFVKEYTDKTSQPCFQSLVGPYPVEIGIGLHYMQMSIHCFFIINRRFSDQQIMRACPIAGENLEISSRLFIESIFFKKLKYIDRCFKSLFITCCPVVFCQSVDKKRLGISLFPGI